MRFNNIRRVVLAVCGCSLMSLQSGNCANPSESGASLPQDSVKNQNEFPELQLMTPVAAPMPVEPKASRESRDKPFDQAAPLQPTSSPATSSANMMQVTLNRPTPTEQNYGHETVELCAAAVDRSIDVHFVLQKLCPGVTSAKGLTRLLVALFLEGDSGTQVNSKVILTGFPCTTQIEILKMEAAHPDLISMLGYSHRAAADDEVRAKYQKALQSIPSKNTERAALFRKLRDTSSRAIGAARDYKIAVAATERAEEILRKLKTTVAEVRSSQTQIQQIELEGVLMRYEADLEESKERCMRFRQSLIDLAGIEAFTKFEKSMKAEHKPVT